MSAALKIIHMFARVWVVEQKDGNEIRRAVKLSFGDPLPANLAEGELERLKRNSAVKAGKLPDPRPPVADPVPPPTPSEAEQATAEKLALLGAMTDEELVDFLGTSGIGAKKVVDAVGDNPELAARVIAAEKTATKGDGRGNLVGPLSKLVESGAGSE